jgi:hypothetical protein
MKFGCASVKAPYTDPGYCTDSWGEYEKGQCLYQSLVMEDSAANRRFLFVSNLQAQAEILLEKGRWAAALGSWNFLSDSKKPQPSFHSHQLQQLRAWKLRTT